MLSINVEDDATSARSSRQLFFTLEFFPPIFENVDSECRWTSVFPLKIDTTHAPYHGTLPWNTAMASRKSTLQWHPAMAPRPLPRKLVITLPLHHSTTMAPAMGPRPLHPAMAPWCLVQSAKVVRRLPPLLEVRTPIAIAIWGKKVLFFCIACFLQLHFPPWTEVVGEEIYDNMLIKFFLLVHPACVSQIESTDVTDVLMLHCGFVGSFLSPWFCFLNSTWFAELLVWSQTNWLLHPMMKVKHKLSQIPPKFAQDFLRFVS